MVYIFGFNIFGGCHIFVESTVQDIELINIEFYILNMFILLMRFRFTVERKELINIKFQRITVAGN